MDIGSIRTLILLSCSLASLFLLSKAVSDSCVDAELGRRAPILSGLLASVRDDCQNTTTTTMTTAATTAAGCVPWNRWGLWFKIPRSVPCVETRFRSSSTCPRLDSQRRACVLSTTTPTTTTTTITTSTSPSTTTTTDDDPIWGPWSFWTQCSSTCGVGLQFRSRQCSQLGACQGRSSQRRFCKIMDCAQATTSPPTTENIVGWLAWNNWTVCSASCGDGIQFRSRNCSHPPGPESDVFCQGAAHEAGSCFVPCSILPPTPTIGDSTEGTTDDGPDFVDPCSIGVHCARMTFNDTVDCPACIHDRRYNCINNCSSYLSCTLGVLAKQPCPTGLWYNPASKVCDFPRDVPRKYCGLDHDNPSGEDEEGSVKTTASFTTRECDRNKLCATLATGASDNCFLCNVGDHYACPDICGYYLTCLPSGRLQKQTCQTGLAFNPEKNYCDFPANVAEIHCHQLRR